MLLWAKSHVDWLKIVTHQSSSHADWSVQQVLDHHTASIVHKLASAQNGSLPHTDCLPCLIDGSLFCDFYLEDELRNYERDRDVSTDRSSTTANGNFLPFQFSSFDTDRLTLTVTVVTRIDIDDSLEA